MLLSAVVVTPSGTVAVSYLGVVASAVAVVSLAWAAAASQVDCGHKERAIRKPSFPKNVTA